jgi:TonB family protein
MAGFDPDWYHPVTMAGVAATAVLGPWRLWSSYRSGEILGPGERFGRTSDPLAYWTHYLATAVFAAGAVAACAIYASQALTRGVTSDAATWFLKPAPDPTYSGYYPDQANAESVNGMAVVQCRVTRTYALERCTVASEQPPGYGFGKAALKIANTWVLPPQDRPKVHAGMVIRFPVRFKMPPGGGTSY